MNKLIVLSIGIALAIVGALYYFLSGGNSGIAAADPQSACVMKCRELVSANKDLSDGPCLMNPIEQFPDWVCDVAHSPRDSSDDLVENQCSDFARYNRAQNFVEVTPNCELIGTGP